MEHDIYLTPEFDARMQSLAKAAEHDPHAEARYKEAVRLVRNLGRGTENGHHPLTDRTAKAHGDLRDCTASEFRSHPEAKLDSRIVWRQFPEQRPGAGPARELVHIGPRHETPDTYHHTIAGLGRTPTERVADNDVFGEVPYTGDRPMKDRAAALEVQRACALTREGVAPMSKSRPLNQTDFGARTGSAPASRSRILSRGQDQP